MRIRTIVQFIPLTWPFTEGVIANTARFLRDARFRLVKAGFEVQSIGLATPPFLDVLNDPDPALLLEFASKLEKLAAKHQIDQVSIGPVVATTPLALLMPIHTLPQLISQTQNIYSGILFADTYNGINLTAAHTFAQIIHKIAQASSNGLGNLRLSALANVPANVPAFPAAYHQGTSPYFAIATEAADLALTAIGNARSLTQANKQLVRSIESCADNVLDIASALVDDHQIQFEGIDFSLAPAPSHARSIGAAVEKLGIDAFGGSGTLFAVSFLTSAIKQAKVPRTGFSGVMLPVLGDPIIATRAEEGHFGVNDLLLYSAICNAGLDCIPIPGDTSPEEIAAIYLDMAALAISTGKPLAARLLPIPGSSVGQVVLLDERLQISSRVLAVKNLGAEDLFKHNSFLTLTPLVYTRRPKQKRNPA